MFPVNPDTFALHYGEKPLAEWFSNCGACTTGGTQAFVMGI